MFMLCRSQSHRASHKHRAGGGHPLKNTSIGYHNVSLRDILSSRIHLSMTRHGMPFSAQRQRLGRPKRIT